MISAQFSLYWSVIPNTNAFYFTCYLNFFEEDGTIDITMQGVKYKVYIKFGLASGIIIQASIRGRGNDNGTGSRTFSMSMFLKVIIRPHRSLVLAYLVHFTLLESDFSKVQSFIYLYLE